MDEKTRQWLDQLPDGPPRSVLEPHLDLIRQLRRKRFTYRGIARFLETELGLRVHWTTIHSFLEVRARRRCDVLRPKYEIPEPQAVQTVVAPSRSGAEMCARIEAAKQCALQPKTEERKRFHFDPEKGLTLPDEVLGLKPRKD